MRRSRWAALSLVVPIAVVFASWGSSNTAVGQAVPTDTPTSTPAPTPTQTPTASPVSVPAVTLVVSAAKAGLRQAGSARVLIVGTLTESTARTGTVKISLSGRSDVSSRQHHIHTTSTTTQRSGGAPERDETIDVGRWTADRSDNGPWSCQHAATLNKKLYDLAQLVTPLKSPWTIAADTVGGVPVWHVHARYDDTINAESGHADYYFSQSDDTLLQGSVMLKLAEQGAPAISLSFKFTLSHFGERVKVKVPSACLQGRMSSTTPASALWGVDPSARLAGRFQRAGVSG